MSWRRISREREFGWRRNFRCRGRSGFTRDENGAAQPRPATEQEFHRTLLLPRVGWCKSEEDYCGETFAAAYYTTI